MINLSKDVRRRIMARCEVEDAIVIVSKNGKPSRVFSLEKYLKMRQHPIKVKPWQFRKSHMTVPDPLGAVEGKIVGSLRRQAIYE